MDLMTTGQSEAKLLSATLLLPGSLRDRAVGRWVACISRSPAVFLRKGSYTIVTFSCFGHSLVTSNSYCEGQISSELLVGDWVGSVSRSGLSGNKAASHHTAQSLTPLSLPFSAPAFHTSSLLVVGHSSSLESLTFYHFSQTSPHVVLGAEHGARLLH